MRFWLACAIALAERAGFYTLLNFAVLYLVELGFGAYWPSLLVGSGLGTAVYVLPLVCGALVDRVGFRRVLMAGAMLLVLGYAALAWPLRAPRHGQAAQGPGVVLAVGLGLGCVALGRSLLNPTCAATVQITGGSGKGVAFGIYFMMTNVGTLSGLVLCRLLRRGAGLGAVFAVALGAAAAALLLAALTREGAARVRRRPPLGRELLGVLHLARARAFLLMATGFFVLFAQTFLLLPLYLQRAVQPDPPLDLYGMIHPLLAVFLQVPMSRALQGVAPVRGIALGTLVMAAAMLCNLPPLWLPGGLQTRWGPLPPAGTLGVLATLALASLALVITLPKMYEFMGSLAPPGEEGLLLGFTTLPMALGNLLGGGLGPWLLNEVMTRGAVGSCLEPGAATAGWLLLSALGLASAAGFRVLRVLRW